LGGVGGVFVDCWWVCGGGENFRSLQRTMLTGYAKEELDSKGTTKNHEPKKKPKKKKTKKKKKTQRKKKKNRLASSHKSVLENRTGVGQVRYITIALKSV